MDLFNQNKATNIIGGNGERLNWDFYPTPKEVTISLLNYFKWGKMNVWEPACGECAISKVLEDFGHNVISTDLKDGVDFFKTEKTGVDAIITNPPFKHSERFIRKAIIDAPIVAMLLKTQYWHASKRSKIFLQHRPSCILALTWRAKFILV